jgi:hypothetical protein
MAKSKRFQDQREKFAQALALGNSPVEAARLAGYRGTGETFAANARRKAQRSDVKARVAELRAPALAEVQKQIDISIAWAAQKLAAIANYDLGMDAAKVSDQISALTLLAKMNGWLAPEKLEHGFSGLGDRLEKVFARGHAGGHRGETP